MDKDTDGYPRSARDDCFEAAHALLDDPAHIMAKIMASMGDGVSIQDRNMRIVYQNNFMIENFGSHVGDYCYKIYEKRDTVCEDCPIAKSFQTGQPTKALRVGVTKEGTPFRFENIASVLQNDEGTIVAGIELCRIVEDREKAFDNLREALEQLKQTQTQLVRAEKLAGIGQLAAGMAHEINTPTMFIMSNLSALQNYVADLFGCINSVEKIIEEAALKESDMHATWEEVRQIVNTDYLRYLKSDLPQAIADSLSGLDRIKTIVYSVLEFASNSQSECCMVNVNEVIESTLLLLNDKTDKKERVVKNLGELPEIHADRQQLQQAFLNLLRNASQAIESEGAIIVKTEAANNRINIEISDSGVGIPSDIIQNIFNPFFTTREIDKGVGLGLSIAYRIVEIHKGSIEVQSEPGHGTTFTIRLPIISEDEAKRKNSWDAMP